MEQLTQDLKKGKMALIEAPFPIMGDGDLLVRNYYSVISPGTEGRTVTDARKGYIAKARSRQKEVKKVIESIKKNGLKETYQLVMNKLEALSALGYSCAGEVIGIGSNVKSFKIGDHVACGGSRAVHADVVSVPVNLCVKVDRKTDLREAAFTTIGAIALQGVRQSDLKLGESAVVIGLGLVGLLTCQILVSSGINVIGIDIDEKRVRTAGRIVKGHFFNRNKEGIEKIIETRTVGTGADAVIIAAATSSLDPVNFAGRICRKRGKVIIVGSVPTGFSREHFYKKELELKMSSSYGPGRYDRSYEEQGIDYPVGYVRWTENRNMQAFVNLIENGKIDLKKIISHEYTLLKAPEAYLILLKKSENFTGIIIKYDFEKLPERKVVLKEKKFKSEKPVVGLIGAGSFAQNVLLPNMKGLCYLEGISTPKANISRYVADKFGFSFCTDNPEELIKNENINTIFIATRHDSHSYYVIESLKAGKNVFVEKPLALTEKELEEIRKVYISPRTSNPSPGGGHLMVGYNRRFSPFVKRIKDLLSDDQPKAMNFRINAGDINPEHWVNDPKTGGGRIIGEFCHFIDLAMFISGSRIKSVYAVPVSDPHNLNNTIAVSMSFINGSAANISYFSNGSSELSKERIEISCDGFSAVIDDFKKMSFFNGKRVNYKLRKQDKGHSEEIKRFFYAIEEGENSPIGFEELYLSSLATFKTVESLRTGKVLNLED